jgi:hypothetical protein
MLLSDALETLTRVLQHITLASLLLLCILCPSAWRKPDALPFEVLSLINRSSCHLTHISMEGNLVPIIERSHSSLVCVGAALPVKLPASVVQRIARRELTLPHLQLLSCILDLNAFTDLKDMVVALWSDGDDIRRVFRGECNILRPSTVGEEDWSLERGNGGFVQETEWLGQVFRC